MPVAPWHHGTMRRWAWLLVWVAACGDNTAGVPDPTEAALAITDPDGTATTSLTLAMTPVGTRRLGRLVVTNTGDRPSGALALVLDGPRDFTLDDETTCAGRVLAGGESCEVVVRYWPVRAGNHAAKLGIAGEPGGGGEVELEGSARLPELHFSPTFASLGMFEVGVAKERTLGLVNEGATTVPIGPVTASGDAAFAIASTTCGATLAAGARCEIVVVATPGALGVLAGALEVTSEHTTYAMPIDVRGGRRITVVRSGSEPGDLVSSPYGIACGAKCTELFDTDVELIAAPGPGARVRWSIPACDTAPTCVIPAEPTPVTVHAQFEPIVASPVTITFAGDMGDARIEDAVTFALLAKCTASCSTLVRVGRRIRIVASSFGSNYGGMTGACTTTSSECERTVSSTGLSVTLQLPKEPYEGWARLLPGSGFRTAAFDDSGNLLLGATSSVTKLAPDGSTIWSSPQSVRTLAAGPSDTIFVQTGTALRKLAPDGGELWTRLHGLGACTPEPSYANTLAVGTDGAVVVQGATGVSRYDANGTLMWSVPLAATGRCAIAIDRVTGNVYVLTENLDDFESTDVVELAATDGAELARTPSVTLQYDARIAAAMGGGSVVCSSGHGIVHLRSPTGNRLEDLGVPNSTPNGCVAAGAGAGWVYAVDELYPETWRLERLGPNGFSHTRRAIDASDLRRGTAPRAIAGSASGRIAVAGDYFGATGHGAWAQVFEP